MCVHMHMHMHMHMHTSVHARTHARLRAEQGMRARGDISGDNVARDSTCCAMIRDISIPHYMIICVDMCTTHATGMFEEAASGVSTVIPQRNPPTQLQ